MLSNNGKTLHQLITKGKKSDHKSAVKWFIEVYQNVM